jgi:signal transduction histidine kinase
MPIDAPDRDERAAALDPLLDDAPCGFLRFTEAGIITLVNRTLLEMLGYERAALTGQHVERILGIASRIFYQTHWFPLLRLHGRADEIFLMLRAAAGEDVGVLTNCVRRDHPGSARYDCILVRVNERQKYEAELLRARRVAEQARAEVEARERALQKTNALLESQALELELQQAQLQEQAAELEATGEELRAINATLTERTAEAERLRDVAEVANQAKSSFLAVMSHELRTPLNAIAGYVELLKLGIHGPVTEAQQETLGRIARSERHLLRLINEVLNLARIEAGHVEYEFERVPLAELVAGVTPMIEPQLEQKGIDFEVDVPPGLTAWADRDKCQQVLLNLLSNAAKFTPPGGRVRIDADVLPERPERVRLRVADTGIGIPADKLEAVFDPFVQVDASRTRAAQGSGLGLAISRDLARGMGGELRAESRSDEGSTFLLLLPAAGPTR